MPSKLVPFDTFHSETFPLNSMFEKTQEKSRMAETSMWFKSHWSPWMALASRIN